MDFLKSVYALLLSFVAGILLGVFHKPVAVFFSTTLYYLLYPFATVLLTPYFFLRHLFMPPVCHLPQNARHLFKDVYFCHFPEERQLHFKNSLVRYKQKKN